MRSIELAVSLLASIAGSAVAISLGILNARRPSSQLLQNPTPAFVTAVLFAAMSGAMIYQGVSNSFPPAFLGAAVFFARVVIALRRALRRPPRTEAPPLTSLAS